MTEFTEQEIKDAYAAGYGAGVLGERQRLKTRIEKLPHGWAETGADDGQGHREGFEACAYSAVLAVLEES